MQWLTVSSSGIEKIAYEIKTRKLFVEFKTGAIYSYQKVPPETFAAFCSAPSLGQFFVKNVRDSYSTIKEQEPTKKIKKE